MNERPKSIEKWSPNFTPCDPGRSITCVVIHATASSEASGSLQWLCDPKSKVSAHYLIDPLGAIYHLVHEQNESWHAGESEWDGRKYVNQFSVGVELVNPNDGKTPYPDDQLVSCADLVAAICKEHNISTKDVIAHADIAPGRKTDPSGLNWDEFRTMLHCRGVSRGDQ